MKRDEQASQAASDFPAGLSAPALRALAGAGYHSLAQLANVSEVEIMQLHGMGPKGVALLRRALATQGLAFSQEDMPQNM